MDLSVILPAIYVCDLSFMCGKPCFTCDWPSLAVVMRFRIDIYTVYLLPLCYWPSLPVILCFRTDTYTVYLLPVCYWPSLPHIDLFLPVIDLVLPVIDLVLPVIDLVNLWFCVSVLTPIQYISSQSVIDLVLPMIDLVLPVIQCFSTDTCTVYLLPVYYWPSFTCDSVFPYWHLYSRSPPSPFCRSVEDLHTSLSPCCQMLCWFALKCMTGISHNHI